MELREKLSKSIGLDRWWFRIFAAEFLGCLMLVLIGNGSVAQSVVSSSKHGTFLSVNIGFALAVGFGVYISGGVSGGHVNPAITLAMCLLGKTRWRQLPVYFVAQYLGCFFGAVLVYMVYYDAINTYDGGHRYITGENGTAGIFGTFPSDTNLSIPTLLLDQICGTAILAMCVLAITDPRNMTVPKGLVPVVVSLVILAIGVAYGHNCGFAVNPARDFGPRFFTYMAGWGWKVFSYNDYKWFWIPILGPHIGAILGALTYEFFVGSHWPSDGADEVDFPSHNGEVILRSMKPDQRTQSTVTPVFPT